MDQPTALRTLQAALHLRIDAAYAALPAAVRRAIRARTTGDALTPVAANRLARDIERLLKVADDRAAAAVAQGVVAARVLAEQDEPNVEQAWGVAAGLVAASLVVAIRRSLADGRQRSMAQVRRVLQSVTLRTVPLAAATTRLEQWVNPWYATRRDATGTLRRVDRVGAFASGPAAPGMAASTARAEMLTGTSDAHGAMAVSVAQRAPGALVKWRLSPWHREADECDDKANRDTGHGPGVYAPTDVPEYPSHPRCRCILTVIEPPASTLAA